MTDGNNGSDRGFAGVDPERQREIASEGGKAAHESGNAHEFSSEEARGAGRRSGEAVGQDREHMAEVGREGARPPAAVRVGTAAIRGAASAAVPASSTPKRAARVIRTTDPPR